MRKPSPDFEEFVARPVIAVLATYRRDGRVLLSPVWHEWRDGGFNVIVEPNDVKARHLRRDPRASIVVAENDAPYHGVELRGEACLESAGADTAFERISKRYLGEREGAEFAASTTGGSLLVRLEPGDLRSWDFADDL